MPIYKGTTKVGPIYLGTTEIIRKYLGTHIFYNSQPDIPADYVQLEWLESTGTQCINLGITNSDNNRYEIEFSATNNSSSRNYVIGGAAVGSVTSSRTQFSYSSTSFYGWGANSTTGSLTVNTNKHKLVMKSDGFYLDETLVYTPTSTSFDGTVNAFLFAMIYGDDITNANNQFGKHRIYSCKVYTNNSLVADLVPVYRVSDGVTGLYDKVSNTFLTNAGTGEFIAPFIPYAYQKVKYIGTTSGTGQYISTGIKATLATKVEVKYRYKSIPSTTAIIVGAHGTATTDRSFLFGCASSGRLYARIDGLTTQVSDVYADTNWHVAVIDKTGAKLDGEQLVTFANPQTFENVNPMAIFGSMDSNADLQYKAYADIEYVKIWNNDGEQDILVRSFVPCFRKSDDVIGMFDEANGVFYTNAGNGTFTKGAIVVDGFKECEYIASDGNQYLDTGYEPNINTKVIIDYIMTAYNGSEVNYIFGAYSSSKSCAIYKRSNSNNNTFGVMFSSIDSSTATTMTINTRYKVSLDKVEATLNGETLKELNATASFSSGNSLYIFRGNGSTRPNAIMKLYSSIIEDNGTRVRYYIPMYRTSDNKIGAFDIINNVFYTNANSESQTDFTKGADI